MNKYTIYCTSEQTKKALELGASIEILPNYTEYRVFPLVKCKDGNERPCIIPTAEQMIGWLEEQESIVCVNIDYYVTDDTWAYWIKFKGDGVYNKQDFNSRKDATLAAIDAALDYLEKQKGGKE